jgi:hypothetical protein
MKKFTTKDSFRNTGSATTEFKCVNILCDEKCIQTTSLGHILPIGRKNVFTNIFVSIHRRERFRFTFPNFIPNGDELRPILRTVRFLFVSEKT